MSIAVKSAPRHFSMSPELREFCDRLEVTRHVPKFIQLLEKCFHRIKKLDLQPFGDPDTGEEWLVVDLRLGGTPRQIMEEYKEYVTRKTEQFPWPLSERIRLNHHR